MNVMGRWLVGVFAGLWSITTVGCSGCPTVSERPPLHQLKMISDQAIGAFVDDLNTRYQRDGRTIRDVAPLVLLGGTTAVGEMYLGASKANLDLAIAGQFNDQGFQVLNQDITDQLLASNNMRWTELANAEKFERFKSILRGAQYEAEEYLLCKSKLTGVDDRKDGAIQRTTVQLFINLSDPGNLKLISQDQSGELIKNCGDDTWQLRMN